MEGNYPGRYQRSGRCRMESRGGHSDFVIRVIRAELIILMPLSSHEAVQNPRKDRGGIYAANMPEARQR